MLQQEAMGGTWLANRYPGLTCDVPIHIYALPWAPKNDWTNFMAPGTEIRDYVLQVAKKFDLNRFVSFKTIVKDAVWDGDAGNWQLTSVLVPIRSLLG
jgi:cation diffusion facilitator CzcD-associated flavoprotein CzcO